MKQLAAILLVCWPALADDELPSPAERRAEAERIIAARQVARAEIRHKREQRACKAMPELCGFNSEAAGAYLRSLRK